MRKPPFRHRFVKGLSAFVTIGLLFGVSAPPAFAHPDIAITLRVLFDMRRGVLTGLGESWSFDATYSRTLLDQYDRDRDGSLSPDETEALRQKLVSDLRRKRFFTNLTMGGKPAAGVEPVGFQAEAHNGLVTVTFAFSVAAPIDLRGQRLDVTIKDRDYTAAFRLADNAGLQIRGDFDNKCHASVAPDPQQAYFARLVVPDQISLTCNP
ncbi:ABC-type uncharacterized transport system substrate-binding protein [Agrobacterium vitis]|nr:ABC-type uncharacterized transport system substrate-binding protein [Agrobacterium vitis]MBE1438194.1 ABC-type uncharacterized transport system substrate-binding protein [Agrobacterium vitis]